MLISLYVKKHKAINSLLDSDQLKMKDKESEYLAKCTQFVSVRNHNLNPWMNVTNIILYIILTYNTHYTTYH